MDFQLVYWDANVFHAMFGAEAGRVDLCLKVEKAARERSLDIYTSTVTFVECVWLKGIPKLSTAHENTIQKYFMNSFIKTVNCDRMIAEQARQLLWKHSLKPKDAIHAATALFVGVHVLHTYDSDLLRLDGKFGLKIEEPKDPFQPPPTPPPEPPKPVEPLPDPKSKSTLPPSPPTGVRQLLSKDEITVLDALIKAGGRGTVGFMKDRSLLDGQPEGTIKALCDKGYVSMTKTQFMVVLPSPTDSIRKNEDTPGGS